MEWTVGDVRVVKVLERVAPVPINGLLLHVPDGTVDRYPWLKPHFVTATGLAHLSFHGLVVDTGQQRILVDTCLGDREIAGLPPGESRFLARLAEAGYSVDAIDIVICTHLHIDHVGWNTQYVDGAWRVTFPAARYLFGRAEWEHWSTAGGVHTNLSETCQPVLDAGQAEFVDVDHVVCAEVRLVPTPGHTPGHVSVVVESSGDRAVITGDLAHSPLQFAEPDLANVADSDPAHAAATRRAFCAERVTDGALVIGTHFADPTAGLIVPDGDGSMFEVRDDGGAA